MIERREFERAFEKSLAKHPSLQGQEQKAFDFLLAFEARRQRNQNERFKEAFGETIRLVLNYSEIIPDERKAYASLIGHYFGKHGNSVQKTRPTQKINTRTYSPPRTPVDKNGQYVYDI